MLYFIYFEAQKFLWEPPLIKAYHFISNVNLDNFGLLFKKQLSFNIFGS